MTDLEAKKLTTREMFRAHLYPSLAIFAKGLATFSTIYFAIQIEPIAQQSRFFHRCVQELKADHMVNTSPIGSKSRSATAANKYAADSMGIGQDESTLHRGPSTGPFNHALMNL